MGLNICVYKNISTSAQQILQFLDCIYIYYYHLAMHLLDRKLGLLNWKFELLDRKFKLLDGKFELLDRKLDLLDRELDLLDCELCLLDRKFDFWLISILLKTNINNMNKPTKINNAFIEYLIMFVCSISFDK
jgi:hypothetical protein